MTHPPQNILINGMDYWPDSTGIAPYTTALAEHLQSRGDQVSVTAGYPYYPQWSVADVYGRSLRRTEERNGVAVRRFRQYVPSKQSAARRLAFEASFLANAAVSRPIHRPDVVVGVVPALADGLLSAMVARRYRVPFVLVVQDLMGSAAEQSGVSGGARIAAMTNRVEGWICRQASAVAVVASGFRDRLIALGVRDDRIHLNRNWAHIGPATHDRAQTRNILGLPQDRFIAIHAGNMGLKQGLDHLIATARMARELAPEILFVLVGDGNQRERLQSLAAGLDNVRFIPPQDEEFFPSVLAASDALLINQLPSVTDMSLPSKLTSYYSAGKPVIAAVADRSETAKVIAESDGGIVVDPSTPADSVAALSGLAADPARAAELGANGTSYAASHLSAEAALTRLEQIIHGAHAQAAITMKGIPAV